MNTVWLPAATNIANETVWFCQNITTFYAPAATHAGYDIPYACGSNINNINLASLTSADPDILNGTGTGMTGNLTIPVPMRSLSSVAAFIANNPSFIVHP